MDVVYISILYNVYICMLEVCILLMYYYYCKHMAKERVQCLSTTTEDEIILQYRKYATTFPPLLLPEMFY